MGFQPPRSTPTFQTQPVLESKESWFHRFLCRISPALGVTHVKDMSRYMLNSQGAYEHVNGGMMRKHHENSTKILRTKISIFLQICREVRSFWITLLR